MHALVSVEMSVCICYYVILDNWRGALHKAVNCSFHYHLGQHPHMPPLRCLQAESPVPHFVSRQSYGWCIHHCTTLFEAWQAALGGTPICSLLATSWPEFSMVSGLAVSIWCQRLTMPHQQWNIQRLWHSIWQMRYQRVGYLVHSLRMISRASRSATWESSQKVMMEADYQPLVSTRRQCERWYWSWNVLPAVYIGGEGGKGGSEAREGHTASQSGYTSCILPCPNPPRQLPTAKGWGGDACYFDGMLLPYLAYVLLLRFSRCIGVVSAWSRVTHIDHAVPGWLHHNGCARNKWMPTQPVNHSGEEHPQQILRNSQVVEGQVDGSAAAWTSPNTSQVDTSLIRCCTW